MNTQNNITVLVVDDDQGVRDMLDTYLTDQEYEVRVAADGEEAIELLDKNHFELVISDLRMPGIGGLEVIQHYKEQNEEGIGIIITGLATVESAVDALRLGVDDFVLKPFNLQHLSEILEKSLELRRIQEENKRLQAEIRSERDELKKAVTVLEIIKDIALKMNYNFSFSELILLVMRHIARVVQYDYAIFVDTNHQVIFAHSSTPINRRQKVELAKYAAKILQDEYQIGKEINDYRFISGKTADHEKPLPEIRAKITMELEAEGENRGVLLAMGTKEKQFANVQHEYLDQLSTDVTRIFNQFWNLLTEQKHRIQLLMDNLSDGVVLIDAFANEIVFNPAATELLGRPADSFTVTEFMDLMEITLDEIKTRCIGEDEVIQTIVDVKGEGKPRVFDVQISGFKYAGYVEEGLVFSLRDITEKAQVEKMKANLIANVSHELKTPIAIIKEYLSLLGDGIGGPLNEQQSEFVEISQSHLNRLDRLIYNFLHVSKLDSGRLQIRPSLHNIHEIIDEALQPFSYRMEQNHLTLQKVYATEMPQTQIDRDAILQVLMNLIDNAIKYSPEGATVAVGTEIENSVIRIWIKDEGVGIQQENIGRIFERFFQEMWDENKPPGTGLGLAITRQLVEEHNGRIWVESPPDEGALFYFTLPIRETYSAQKGDVE